MTSRGPMPVDLHGQGMPRTRRLHELDLVLQADADQGLFQPTPGTSPTVPFCWPQLAQRY